MTRGKAGTTGTAGTTGPAGTSGSVIPAGDGGIAYRAKTAGKDGTACIAAAGTTVVGGRSWIVCAGRTFSMPTARIVRTGQSSWAAVPSRTAPARTCRISSRARPTGSVAGGARRGATRVRPARVEPEGVRSTGGPAVGGVGWCEPLNALGRTIAVDRRHTARGGRRWQRQAELTRSGLSRLLPWLALGRRRPLAGHVVRVSHASLLPQPRTARANRRQDAGGAVTVTTLRSCLARWTASGHGRAFAGEGRPAQDSCPVVHAGPRLAQRRLRSAVVAGRIGLTPHVRPDGVCAARRTNRPLWTDCRRREWSGRLPAGRRLGVRSIRRRPCRRGA
jgi:hypothetical protein